MLFLVVFCLMVCMICVACCVSSIAISCRGVIACSMRRFVSGVFWF